MPPTMRGLCARRFLAIGSRRQPPLATAASQPHSGAPTHGYKATREAAWRHWRRAGGENEKKRVYQARVFDGRTDSRNKITIYDPKVDGTYLGRISDCG